ncbi:MAG: class I SAM-dependent methyltransferase [Thermoplasmata archaeon]
MDKEWFQDQEFWEEYRSVLFHEHRLQTTPQQVKRLIDLLEIKKGDKVLDLCCGIGRHSLGFASKGYDVTGVDISEYYIQEAKGKASNAGLSVEFVQEDMREFKREEQYDAAMIFFTSFGYFIDDEDNFKVLKNVYSSLKPGGTFLIDIMGKEVWARVFSERDWARMENGFFLEERKVKGNWDLIDSNWILIQDGGVHEHSFITKLYSAKELRDMLKRAGFRFVDIYGDLERSEYNEKSDRLIAVAHK